MAMLRSFDSGDPAVREQERGFTLTCCNLNEMARVRAGAPRALGAPAPPRLSHEVRPPGVSALEAKSRERERRQQRRSTSGASR